MSKSQRGRARKSSSGLHREIERRAAAERRKAILDPKTALHAVITDNWDGSKNVLVESGHGAHKVEARRGAAPVPGQHCWVAVISYAVDIDAFDARDPDDPGSGLGVLGPDKIVSATPPICSECATVYTPEERNTRCSGVVPGD